MKVLVTLALATLPARCWWDTVVEHPPELKQATYLYSEPRTMNAGETFVEWAVDGQTPYNGPNGGGKCDGQPHPASAPAVMNADGIMDITIQFSQGIAPGIGNARAFTLSRIGSAYDTSWVLLIRQADVATDYLTTVTWRMKLNAKPTPSEIGNGGLVMPPYGDSPWERPIAATAIKGTYRLQALNGVEPRGLATTLAFKMPVGVNACP